MELTRYVSSKCCCKFVKICLKAVNEAEIKKSTHLVSGEIWHSEICIGDRAGYEKLKQHTEASRGFMKNIS